MEKPTEPERSRKKKRKQLKQSPRRLTAIFLSRPEREGKKCVSANKNANRYGTAAIPYHPRTQWEIRKYIKVEKATRLAVNDLHADTLSFPYWPAEGQTSMAHGIPKWDIDTQRNALCGWGIFIPTGGRSSARLDEGLIGVSVFIGEKLQLLLPLGRIGWHEQQVSFTSHSPKMRSHDGS